MTAAACRQLELPAGRLELFVTLLDGYPFGVVRATSPHGWIDLAFGAPELRALAGSLEWLADAVDQIADSP